MLNLPIKIVDLVTLLFLSLLVVIIIFIILQRNIKRFKLRNVKDPHFLACKSIPKELKEAILRKHAVSHVYSEPEQILTSNYANSTDEGKTFLLRMKAFETSKNLESALSEYGYRRPQTMKFEEFIDQLLNIDDETLPKDMLREFNRFYLWAMLDPMKFDLVELRKLNRLINRIIESLASKKKTQYDELIQHRLDLNENGDYDFSRRGVGVGSGGVRSYIGGGGSGNNIIKTNTMKSKSVKFGESSSGGGGGISQTNNPSTSATANSNNNNNNISVSLPTYSTNVIESPFETNMTTQQSRSLKIKEQATKLAKSVFSKKNSTTEEHPMAESPSTLLLG